MCFVLFLTITNIQAGRILPPPPQSVRGLTDTFQRSASEGRHGLCRLTVPCQTVALWAGEIVRFEEIAAPPSVRQRRQGALLW